MSKFFSRLLFICFLLSIGKPLWGQTLGFEIADNAKQVQIPFEIYNNLIVIPVILNHKLPLKFILDTGVRTTILTEKAYTDILNLQYARKYTISGLGDQLIDAYVTNNVSLTLPGGLQGRGHAMLVLEHDYLELKNYLGAHVHGILGYEIFSRFIVDINYDQRILTLTTPENFKQRKSFDEIDITIEDTKPYVTGSVVYKNGKKVTLKLLIDSGASHGLVLDEGSDPNITIPKPNITTSLGRGLGGLIHGKIARMQAFHIGEACWEDIITTFPESNTLLDSLKMGDTFRNGSIGGEILSRFHVIINFPEEKILLKKGKQFKKLFTYNISGITVKAKGSRLNTYEIVEVRENSVGEQAGFKPGDIVISINNVDASRLQLNHIINYLNAKENKKVKLTVLRDGKEIKRKFRLKSPI